MIGREFWVIAAILVILATATNADVLTTTRTLRAKSIIALEDLAIQDGFDESALSRAEDAVGSEARVALYAGRPIHPQDIGPAAIVDRNQIVAISFNHGSLTITIEGRAMERGGVGDTIRVMNASSRVTVNATINPDGSLTVLSQ